MCVFCNYFATTVQWLLRSLFHIGKKHYLLKSRPLVRGTWACRLAAPKPKELPRWAGASVGVGRSCGRDGQALVFRASVAFPWVGWLSAPK